MKLTLYMATTSNGYIAELNGDTSWVLKEDWDQLFSFISKVDVVVMGRHTYDMSKKEGGFPYGKVLNIVLTSQPSLYSAEENTFFTNKTPKELMHYLQEKNVEKVLLIGGSITNTRFLNDSLIDELILSVHPIILGKGIKVFNDFNNNINLKLNNVHTVSNKLVYLNYSIEK